MISTAVIGARALAGEHGAHADQAVGARGEVAAGTRMNPLPVGGTEHRPHEQRRREYAAGAADADGEARGYDLPDQEHEEEPGRCSRRDRRSSTG